MCVNMWILVSMPWTRGPCVSGAHVCEHVDSCIDAVDEGSVCEWRTRV